jgi:hypothetical protein
MYTEGKNSTVITKRESMLCIAFYMSGMHVLTAIFEEFSKYPGRFTIKSMY